MQGIDPMIATLPQSIRAVAEHIGMGIVRRMIDVIPGTRIQIPRSATREPHNRSDAEPPFYQLEPEDQKALMREFGGDVIDVPTKIKTWQWRHAQIRELAAKGLPINEIALEVGVTRRTVFGVIAKLKKREQSKSTASLSISDGHLTPHAESVSHPPCGKIKNAAYGA